MCPSGGKQEKKRTQSHPELACVSVSTGLGGLPRECTETFHNSMLYTVQQTLYQSFSSYLCTRLCLLLQSPAVIALQ